MTPIETTLFVSACAWGIAWTLWSSGKIHVERRRALAETTRAEPPTVTPGFSSVEAFRTWEKRRILRTAKAQIRRSGRLSGEIRMLLNVDIRKVPYAKRDRPSGMALELPNHEPDGEIIGHYQDGTPLRAWRGQ